MLTETLTNPILMNRWSHWDPFKHNPCTVVLPHFPLCLFLIPPAALAFLPFLVFPILPEWPASRKTELQKNNLSAFGALSASRSAGFFFIKFALHHEVNSSRLSLHWLARLSENPIEGVCGRSLFTKQKILLSDVFSNTFFACAHTLKSSNSKGVCSMALKFWKKPV